VAERDTFHDTIGAYRKLFRAYLATGKASERKVLTTARVQQAMSLLTTLINLEIINLHVNEILTASVVLDVLQQLGWKHAVDTWMNFQSSLYCSNGIAVLLRYALTRLDKKDVQMILSKATDFLPAQTTHSFHAAALVACEQVDAAEEVLGNATLGINAKHCVSPFRVNNAMFISRTPSRVGNFALNFTKVCLSQTDLKHEPIVQDRFHTDWLRIIEEQRSGLLALDFYELFATHGVALRKEYLDRVLRVVDEERKLIDKWFFQPAHAVLSPAHVHEATKTLCDELDSRCQVIISDCNNSVPSTPQSHGSHA
ncbi:Protein C04E6.11, partial [Aphelenchoides avenae]